MAKRGDITKEFVKNMIITAAGSNFVGIFDKKLYVKVEENGEWVQCAISLTIPKVAIAENQANVAPSGNPHDWTETKSDPVVSSEDEKKVQELMKTLGII